MTLSLSTETRKEKEEFNLEEKNLSHFFKTNGAVFIHINCVELISEVRELLFVKCAS